MQYKGYTGRIEIDEDAGVIFGQVTGLRDVITFQGETVGEARKAFEESVDDYLRFCEEKGQSPEKPYSGKFLVRIKTSLHRELVNLAEARNQSLNTLVEQLLEQGVRETQHGLGKRPELGRGLAALEAGAGEDLSKSALPQGVSEVGGSPGWAGAGERGRTELRAQIMAESARMLEEAAIEEFLQNLSTDELERLRQEALAQLPDPLVRRNPTLFNPFVRAKVYELASGEMPG